MIISLLGGQVLSAEPAQEGSEWGVLWPNPGLEVSNLTPASVEVEALAGRVNCFSHMPLALLWEQFGCCALIRCLWQGSWQEKAL